MQNLMNMVLGGGGGNDPQNTRKKNTGTVVHVPKKEAKSETRIGFE